MSKRFTFFLFLVIILAVLALSAQAQQELRQFGIAEVFRGGDSIFIKKLKTVVIKVTDGLVTKQDTNIDSARLFISSDGAVYLGTTVWKKVGGVVVPPVDPPTGTTEKIDGSKAIFAPLANWTLGTAAGWYGDADKPNSIAYSNATGATATYTFTGTKIELFGELLPSHGLGTVTLNGVTTQVSFRGPSKLPALIYSSPALPLGTHTIKLTVGSGYCLLDYFILTK